MDKEQLLQAFAEVSGLDAGEFEIALLVGLLIDGAMDLQVVRTNFEQLVASINEHKIDDVSQLLDLFRQHGFGDAPLVSVDLTHSSLDWVLRQKQGIPIAVSILLVEGARRLGFTATGINFPGHFLTRIDGVLVDPMTMRVIEAGDLDLDLADAPAMLIKASTTMVGLRMLNNIKALYMQAKNWLQVLEIIDYQFAINDGSAEVMASLHYERGECWQQLGVLSAARYEFNACAAICPHPQLTTIAEQRATALKVQDETVH
jgi:regulator of sirC expression with transglutaminase-like and TPR domain